MAKNWDLPNKIIIVKEGLEVIKELMGLFIGKLQTIQGKLKVLS